jgi:hypothetical protein
MSDILISILSGTLSHSAPVVDWWVIRGGLEIFPGSVCYIFDICFSMSSVFESYEGAEFMGASGWGTQATASHNSSFTRALIDTLKSISYENSTLATVYSTLVRNARNSQQSVSPVYVCKPNTQSVTIGNQIRHAARPIQAAARNELRVLLSVNIDDINDPRALNIDFWRNWSPQPFAGMSPGTIKVEALYTGSLVLLFSLPVEMWLKLPDDGTYTYVAHITSTNLLAEQPEINLPIRPPRDTKENRSISRSPEKPPR